MRGAWLCGWLLLCCVACAPPAARSAPNPAPPDLARYPEITHLDLSQARALNPAAGQHGAIRYALSAPALVRIRIVDGRTPGIVWRTLLDWSGRAAGEHEELWDGRDAHGEPLDPRAVSIVLTAEPDRTLLSPSDRKALNAERYPEIKHWTHPPERCGDLDVHMSGITPDMTVSGQVSLNASLSGQLGMPDDEYHVVVYVDGRAAWDGRVRDPRLEESLDTRNLTNGGHWLAVTFNDLHDHAGSDWVWFTVMNE